MITQYSEPETNDEIKITTEQINNLTILNIYHNQIQHTSIQVKIPEKQIHSEIRDVHKNADIQINQTSSSIIEK